MLSWLVVSIIMTAVGSGILMQARKSLAIDAGFFLACAGSVSLLCFCAVAAVKAIF